jgi:dipeptidyl aminopeptidase/acylaminoacyl peptidase
MMWRYGVTAIRSQIRLAQLIFSTLLVVALLAVGAPITAAPVLQVAPNATTSVYLPAILRNYTALKGRIVFETNRDGNTEIYLLNAAGLDTLRLINNAVSDRDPVWSPNGAKIAFVSYRDGNNEIYVMNADGSGQLNVSKNSEFDGLPSWSPDGKHVAYSSRRLGTLNLWVVTVDGLGQRPLTNSTSLTLYTGTQWHQ